MIGVTDLFKSTIYYENLINDNYVNYFINLLKKQKKEKNKNIHISNIGGYQSLSFNQIDNVEIENKLFLDPCLRYISTFKKRSNTKSFGVKLLNFWINSNKNNDYNLMHNHDSNFSGVYYLKVPKNSGRLVFQNGDLSVMNDKNFDYFDDNNFYARYFCEIKKYDLLIFPSRLFHYVEPNRSKEERISVAFNLNIVDL
jgi:uncharacterized protein (TIGR02466 family)